MNAFHVFSAICSVPLIEAHGVNILATSIHMDFYFSGHFLKSSINMSTTVEFGITLK